MKKYLVSVETSSIETYQVEAKSKKEAEEKWFMGEFIFDKHSVNKVLSKYTLQV